MYRTIALQMVGPNERGEHKISRVRAGFCCMVGRSRVTLREKAGCLLLVALPGLVTTARQVHMVRVSADV